MWSKSVDSDDEAILKAFKAFDLDGDGYISKDEIIKALTKAVDKRESVVSMMRYGKHFYNSIEVFYWKLAINYWSISRLFQ